MAKEIAPEVQEPVDRQMGQMMGVKRELRELPEVLHDEEQVLHLMKTRVETKSGIPAVTNQRVIFIWMGMVRREFVDWPYDRINSVKADKGLMSHSLVFNAGGSEHRVGNIFTKEKLDVIASTIRDRTRTPQTTPTGAAPAPAPAGDTVDVAEQIRQLGELRDQGLITDEEFTAKKRQLLGICTEAWRAAFPPPFPPHPFERRLMPRIRLGCAMRPARFERATHRFEVCCSIP